MYIGWGYIGFWETGLYDKDFILIDSQLWTTQKKAQEYMDYLKELKKIFPEDFNDCTAVMGGKNIYLWGGNSNAKKLMINLKIANTKREEGKEFLLND